ncbi:MAG: MmgE/PrpD family protein [Chloroflexota bacterium]|nr:MmgE/PrpD family protein [Chloroflexota bacterium]
MTVSQQIANFICGTGYGDLPDDVIDRARQCFLDSIGVALYGVSFEASRISVEMVRDVAGKAEATVLGTELKAPSFLAALANGISGHVTDYDDVLIDSQGHPSCVLMPATLALAEKCGSSGRDLLGAFVLGSEVAGKLGLVMGMEHYAVGFHSTGTIGTVAAAAAASKILGLPAAQVSNALGIAASGAGGLRQNFGTMTKCWHAGHAASTGVMAALLAQKGYDASGQALDGKAGFRRAFQGGETPFSVAQMGNPYSLTKIQFKRHPSCAFTHPPVDAALKIREEHQIQPEQVASVVCHVVPRARSVLIYQCPESALQAKFSLEYCVAAALLWGHLGIEQFTDEAVALPEVKQMIEKISVALEPSLEEIALKKRLINPCLIELKLKDGREFSLTVEEARGSPSDPLSWADLEEKFLSCSRRTLSASRAREFIAHVKQLEKMESATDLVILLKPEKTWK